MASNPPAPAPFVPSTEPFGFPGPRSDEGPWEEWNPTEDSIAPVRGRHRVAKQRGGGLARSSTVLGVGVIAAVGAGGMASANTGKPPVSISMPDLGSVGHMFGGSAETPKGSATALSTVGVSTQDTEQGAQDAGQALRDRIMAQAESQQVQVDSKTQSGTEAALAKQVDDAAAKEKAEAEAKKAAEAARLAELAKQYKLPVVSYTITGT